MLCSRLHNADSRPETSMVSSTVSLSYYQVKWSYFTIRLKVRRQETAIRPCGHLGQLHFLVIFNGSDLANVHSRYFFFLANGAGAMNSYCRELLSPQTGIAALTLTVMKGFEAKKVNYYSFFLYPYTPRILSFISDLICTTGGSRTRVSRHEVKCSNHYATMLAQIKRRNVVFKLNVWKRQCLHSRGKKNTANVPFA